LRRAFSSVIPIVSRAFAMYFLYADLPLAKSWRLYLTLPTGIFATSGRRFAGFFAGLAAAVLRACGALVTSTGVPTADTFSAWTPSLPCNSFMTAVDSLWAWFAAAMAAV